MFLIFLKTHIILKHRLFHSNFHGSRMGYSMSRAFLQTK